MAEEAIRGEQIIKTDWANNAIDNALLLDEAFQKLRVSITETAKSSQKIFPTGDPTTVAGLKEQNKAIEESVKLAKLKAQADIQQQKAEQELLKTQQQRDKVEQQNLKTQQAKVKATQQQIGIINNLRNELKQVTIEWTQTTKAEQLDINVTGSLAQKKKILTENLKRLEEATGDHRRSVGNYEKSLKGLNGVLTIVEKTTGLNLSAFRDFGAGLKTVSAISKATGLSMRASFAIATGGIGLLITGITLLVSSFSSLGAATDKQKTKEELINEQLELQIKLREEIERFGRKKLTTEEVLDKIKSGADKSAISITELKDALAELEQQASDFNTAQKQYQIDAQKQGLLGVDPEVYKKDQLEKQALKQKDIDLIKSIIDVTEKETKVVKEKNKVKEKEVDLELQMLEAQYKSIKQGEEENKLWKGSHTEVAILIEKIKELKTERDRLNLTQAEFIGDKSTSPKALTDKELDEEQKKNESKIAAAKKVGDELFKITENRIKREQDLNKQNLSEIDKGLDQQLQLLIAGQSNIYSAMLKQKAQALEEQARLEKKAAKEKEAQQLTEIFLEFLKADISAGGGKKGFNAAAKALAQTILAKGIASGLSGFFEGTEDTGKGGNVDSNGGMLAVLHPHERVLTAKQNAMIGGLSNEELVNSVMNYKIPTDKSRGQNVIDAQNSILISELKELNNTIKNKKELEVNWNRLNEIILTNKQNGYTVETTYKNSKIVNRESPFKNGRIN